MKITRTKMTDHSPMDKRTYLPFIVESECPACKTPEASDLSTQYLSYPVIGEPCSVYFECQKCDTDWTEEVVIDVTLAPAQKEAT